jgi:hypothetical protein
VISPSALSSDTWRASLVSFTWGTGFLAILG